jgi:hypothetical protein
MTREVHLELLPEPSYIARIGEPREWYQAYEIFTVISVKEHDLPGRKTAVIKGLDQEPTKEHWRLLEHCLREHRFTHYEWQISNQDGTFRIEERKL